MNTPHNPRTWPSDARRTHRHQRTTRAMTAIGVGALMLLGACDPADRATSPNPNVAPPTANQPPETNPRNDGLTVIAYDAAGRVVQIPPETLEPEPLFDVGPLNEGWETIDVSLINGVGFISTCCEPATGAVYEVRTNQNPPLDPAPTPGYGVSISPNERFVAIGQFTGNPVSIKDLTTDEWIESDAVGGWAEMAVGEFTPADVMWINDQRLLVLGTMLTDPSAEAPEYVIFDVEIDGDGHLISASDALSTEQAFDPDQPILFAGRLEPFDSAYVGLHARGSSNVVMIDPVGGDYFVMGTAPGIDTVWFDPGPYEVTVDAGGNLAIDTVPVPGTYAWARTT